MEYYSATKGTDLKCVMLTERSQTYKAICYLFQSVWHSGKVKTIGTAIGWGAITKGHQGTFWGGRNVHYLKLWWWLCAWMYLSEFIKSHIWKGEFWVFPGGPMVRTLFFQLQGVAKKKKVNFTLRKSYSNKYDFSKWPSSERMILSESQKADCLVLGGNPGFKLEI